MATDAATATHPALSGRRCLFVFLGNELGGAERQGLLLARYLKDSCAAQVEVWGLMADGPGRVAELCHEANIAWHPAPFELGAKKTVWLRELCRTALRLRRSQPDVILAYTWLPNIVCGLIWRLTGARVFIWNQRDEGFDLNRSFLHRLATHLTPYFVANSAGGREFLLKNYSIEAHKCATVHNAIPVTEPNKKRETFRLENNVSETCLVACMLGNLHVNKDHATLLKAWRLVLDHYAKDKSPKLLLAGRFDMMAGPLHDLAGQLELEDTVIFLGEVRDVPTLLHAADLYVHSSKSEGLPNGVLEAMAAGLPVVGTNIPGIREALGDGAGDCLAPPGDAEVLAGKIFAMFRDAPWRAACGDANYQRILAEFSPQKMFAEYSRFL